MCCALAFAGSGIAQGPGQSSSSKHTKSSSARLVSDIGAGAVANGVYRNPAVSVNNMVSYLLASFLLLE